MGCAEPSGSNNFYERADAPVKAARLHRDPHPHPPAWGPAPSACGMRCMWRGPATYQRGPPTANVVLAFQRTRRRLGAVNRSAWSIRGCEPLSRTSLSRAEPISRRSSQQSLLTGQLGHFTAPKSNSPDVPTRKCLLKVGQAPAGGACG